RISEAHQFFLTKLLGLSQPSADGEEEPLTLAEAAEGSRISEAHQFFLTKLLGLSQPSADGEEEPLTLAE
ncbi:hypothetical protein D9C01_13960, partial [Corynebacterium diphtheriae]